MVNLKTHNAVGLSTRLHSYGPRIAVDALSLADYAHDGQFRKECRVGVEYKDPYIAHPMRNALRVARFTENHMSSRDVQELMISSLLHDTVEDAAARVVKFYGSTPTDNVRGQALGLILSNFNATVFDTVSRVTNPEFMKSLSREERNQKYLDHLRDEVVGHEFAYLTKASDIIDNAGSLKYMDACDKRRNLATKYTTPIQLMLAYSHVVSDKNVRESVMRRLGQVFEEIDRLSCD